MGRVWLSLDINLLICLIDVDHDHTRYEVGVIFREEAVYLLGNVNIVCLLQLDLHAGRPAAGGAPCRAGFELIYIYLEDFFFL